LRENRNAAVREMHPRLVMATTAQFPNIHTLAGARWLAPFAAAVVAALVIAFLMFVYPHVSA
jgi:hypothetical protein